MRVFELLCRKDLKHSEKIVFIAISISCGEYDCTKHTRLELIKASGVKLKTFDAAIFNLKRKGFIGKVETRPVVYTVDEDWKVEDLTYEMSRLIRYSSIMPATKVVGLYTLLRSKDYSAPYRKIADRLNMSPTTLTHAYRRLVNKNVIFNHRLVGKGQRRIIIRRPVEGWSKR